MANEIIPAYITGYLFCHPPYTANNQGQPGSTFVIPHIQLTFPGSTRVTRPHVWDPRFCTNYRIISCHRICTFHFLRVLLLLRGRFCGGKPCGTATTAAHAPGQKNNQDYQPKPWWPMFGRILTQQKNKKLNMYTNIKCQTIKQL